MKSDEQLRIAEAFNENDFVVEVSDELPPEPAYSFFSHVYPKGEATWGVIVGIRWSTVGSTWEYQLDTDYDEWVVEDQLEVHVLQKG